MCLLTYYQKPVKSLRRECTLCFLKYIWFPVFNKQFICFLNRWSLRFMTSTLKGVYQSLCIFLSEQQIQMPLGFHGIQVRSLMLSLFCLRINNILTHIFEKALKFTWSLSIIKLKEHKSPISILDWTCYKNLKRI